MDYCFFHLLLLDGGNVAMHTAARDLMNSNETSDEKSNLSSRSMDKGKSSRSMEYDWTINLESIHFHDTFS
jgi:hypothetical protein